MTSFRQKLLQSPVRYRCTVCGKRLAEFHLCWKCLQPVHTGCTCHPSTEPLNEQMTYPGLTREMYRYPV